VSGTGPSEYPGENLRWWELGRIAALGQSRAVGTEGFLDARGAAKDTRLLIHSITLAEQP
jgi:hypothetical protein